MKKSLVVSGFALAIVLSSCLPLFRGQHVDTGTDPIKLAGLTGDFGLTNTGRPEVMGTSTRVSSTKTSPLPSPAPFADTKNLNSYISAFGIQLSDLTSWNVCYGFQSANITGIPNGATLPNTITLSGISAVLNVQDAAPSSASVNLATVPANAAITLTKNASNGYNITTTNNKLCAVIPGTGLAAINAVLSNGTGNNTVTGSITYTVDQDVAIGGSPVLHLVFDAGESYIII